MNTKQVLLQLLAKIDADEIAERAQPEIQIDRDNSEVYFSNPNARSGHVSVRQHHDVTVTLRLAIKGGL